MGSKVIFCVLALYFEFVASIPFSEETVQQAASQVNNWQNNQDNPEQSRNYGTGFLRTQSVNSAANSPQRYENGQDYNTRPGIQQRGNYGYKHQPLPLKPLPLKERQSSQSRLGEKEGELESIIPGEFHSIRKENRHVSAVNQPHRQQNWKKQNQIQATASASTSGIIRNERPLIPEKQLYNAPNRWSGNVPRPNFQNIPKEATYPMNRNRNYPSESNYRSRPDPASYETYDEVPFTAPNTKIVSAENNRYVENSPSQFGDANSPLSPVYRGPPKSDSSENLGNLPTAGDKSRNRKPNYPYNNNPPAFIGINTDNKYAASNSEAVSKSFKNVHQEIPTAKERENLKQLFENPTHSHRFMIIHQNDTVEFIDDIASIIDIDSDSVTMVKEDRPSNDNEKAISYNSPQMQQVPQNDNYYPPLNIQMPTGNNYNPVANNQQPNERNYYPTSKPFTSKDSEWVDNSPQIQQVPQNDNYYPPPNIQRPSGNNYNSVANNQQPNERNFYPTSKPFTSKDSDWVDSYVPSVSEFVKPSQVRSPSDTGTSDKMRQKNQYSPSDKYNDNIDVSITGTGPIQPSGNDNNPPPQSYWSPNNNNYNRPDQEEKKIQQFLDSLPDSDGTSVPLNSESKNAQTRPIDDNYYQSKPISQSSTVQRSSTVNPEDDLVQEFFDSLNKTTSSAPPSVPPSDNEDTTTQFTVQPTTASSVTATTPISNAMDEIITISPLEISTDKPQKQASEKVNDDSKTSSNDKDVEKKEYSADDDDLSLSTNNATKTDDDKNTFSQTKYNNTAVATKSTKQSDANSNDNTTDTNELKLILKIPNDSAGTLNIAVDVPDSAGNEDTSNDETVKIRLDTKEYSDSESTANKLNDKSTSSGDKDQSANDGVDKNNNIFIDILNSGMMFRKMNDKDPKNPASTDDSVVNMWYLIPMQPQCQSMVEKNKVTTIYPNGTVVEEITKTTWKSKDDSAPTMEKTTKIFYTDPKG